MKSTLQTPRASTHRADIDGMRAIAVLLVLVFHFHLVPSAGSAGFMGVDVFFVISGFLITSILVRQLDEGSMRLPSFYLGRVRRLAPALLATMVLVMVAGAVLLFPDDFTELARQVLVSQLYAANIFYWRSINYFGLGTDNVFLLHTWSLAVEEQFYLLYPLALIAVYRIGRRWLLPAVIAAMLVSFAANLAFIGSKPEATFYLLPTRAWELLAGAAVALGGDHWHRTRHVDQWIAIAGAMLIALAVTVYRADIRYPGTFALLPAAGASGLILAGSRSTTAVSTSLSRPLLVYVGKISYPLYLVHWPINVFARRWLADGYSVGWRLAMFTASVVLAAAIYHVVEQPVRERRVFSGPRPLLRAYATGVGALAAVFAVALVTGGLPQRFPREAVRLASYVNDKSPPLEECRFEHQSLASESDFCRIGRLGTKPRWLVYGDSHAWAAHAAFDAWLRHKGESGLFVYRDSCPPIIGIHLFPSKGECFAFNEAVARFLGAHPDIHTVVLVSTWRQAPEGRLSTSDTLMVSKSESLRLFDEKFGQTLAYVHGLGRRVIVWEPVPGAARSVPIALARAVVAHSKPDIEITREQYLADNRFFFDALERHRDLVTLRFSPARALCGSGRCAATIDGIPAYFDNAHMTRSPYEFWARMMASDEQRAMPVARPAAAPLSAVASVSNAGRPARADEPPKSVDPCPGTAVRENGCRR